jgi:hypothetical protein
MQHADGVLLWPAGQALDTQALFVYSNRTQLDRCQEPNELVESIVFAKQ